MPRPERGAEVEARDLAHPVGELLPHRLVEAELVALLVDDRLGHRRARVFECHDVAGNGTHDDEGQDGDADERRNHEQEPPGDVPAHPVSLGRLPLVR